MPKAKAEQYNAAQDFVLPDSVFQVISHRMEGLDGALESIFHSTNGCKADAAILVPAAPAQEYGPQLPIRPIDGSSRGNFQNPVPTCQGPHGLPRRTLANGLSPSGDGSLEEAMPFIGGIAGSGQGPTIGLTGSMKAAQQEDSKKFRFWKGSAGSLRHRSAADIPNDRYREEPILSPTGRAGIPQHNATVASSSQQGTSSGFFNGASTWSNDTNVEATTHAYDSDASASKIHHPQAETSSVLNVSSNCAAESEAECDEGPQSSEGQNMDRLFLQLPLGSSIHDSERSVGTPAPLADLRHLDDSASLRSVDRLSGQDDDSAAMCLNVPSEDSSSTHNSVDDEEAGSEWDMESSTSSNGPWEDELMTPGEKGTMGIPESLLAETDAQAHADSSMEEQGSDVSDDDSGYSTAGKQPADKEIHATHRGGEAGPEARSRHGVDAGNGSGSDISEDELFDYYTTVEERMQKFSVLYGDQEEENANPIPVFQEGGDAAGQPQGRRHLISPERLWRYRQSELRNSAIQRFKARNAQSLLAQHRAGANVHGKELIGSAPLLRPAVHEVKRQAAHPHRLPAMATKISNEQGEQSNVHDLIPPARLRQAAKIKDKVAELPSWKLAGASLESYDLKAALGSVENQDMPVFKSMPQLGSHVYGNDIAASRYSPGQQEFHRNGPDQKIEDNHFLQRAPRVGFKQMPLPGSRLPANDISGNDGQDMGPWSSHSSARRSGRVTSGAPNAVLAPLPKAAESPHREVKQAKQAKQKDKQASRGKADEDEGTAMGWLETHDLIPNISLDDEGLDLQAIATYGISGRDADGNVQEEELQRNSEFQDYLSPTPGFSKDSFKLRVPPPPTATSNIIPSRSKIFDAAEGFDAGHRQKPEIHNAMSTSQLQEVLCQCFIQAAKDIRSMNIATESSGIVLSPARREAQRRMTANSGASKSGAWSIAEWLGGKGNWRSETCSPQEMLLQIVISGRVTQEVLISTLQRQSRDVQDATIKLFANFTARCAPQNRCQVAAVCAVADMTAFANLLVTSKLEVAEQMLMHPPATHDEANLLSCKLALDWGKKNIGNIHPNVEQVLRLVHRCMSKVGDRMDDQKDRLHQMRIRRGNAAALYQASQRVMLGAMSGMFELECQVSELVMNMVSCSKFFLVGYNAIEKALYIRGKREPMDYQSAMVTAILDRVPLNISSLGDERVTELDLKRILRCYKMGLKVRNMLIVPVFHKRGTDRSRCVGLMVALNKKTKGIPSEERKGHLSAFQDADKTTLRKAGAILAPAVIAAMRHTEMSISQSTIAARYDKAQRFVAFSSAVHQSLDPSEMWGSIMEEAPAIFNCARVVLYMYVENGIVAVQNPEGEMLEFLTIEEAGIAGEMFNSRAPRYLSTRTHAMNKQEEDVADAPTDVGASSSPKRVTIQDPEAGASSSGLLIHESEGEDPATMTDSTPRAASELISEKRPESRETFWNPQYSDESLSKCLMPEPSIPVYSLLLAPLRQRVSIEEAKRLRAHLKRKVVAAAVADYSDDDSDDDDDYVDEGKDIEVTWAVLVAMNKELTREQEEENMLARGIRKIQTKACDAAGSKQQSWRAGRGRGGRNNTARTSIMQEIYPEFSNTDEATVEAIGRVVYPAMVNAQVQPILQQHLSNLLG